VGPSNLALLILPPDLHVLKVALLKEDRSTVLDNRVMRRIYGPKRDYVKGCRRVLNSEKR
jgi:hypothetical protein